MAQFQENINHLLQLVIDNPGVKILPIVDTECIPSNDFNSWVAGWGKARVEEVWSNIDRYRIYIKSTDYDVLVDGVIDEEDNEITEEEARKIVDSYGWEKVIVIHIHLP